MDSNQSNQPNQPNKKESTSATKVKKKLYSLSHSIDWETAKREWNITELSNTFQRCLCDRDSKHYYTLKNKMNGNIAFVGTVCMSHIYDYPGSVRTFKLFMNRLYKNKSVMLSCVECGKLTKRKETISGCDIYIHKACRSLANERDKEEGINLEYNRNIPYMNLLNDIDHSDLLYGEDNLIRVLLEQNQRGIGMSNRQKASLKYILNRQIRDKIHLLDTVL